MLNWFLSFEISHYVLVTASLALTLLVYLVFKRSSDKQTLLQKQILQLQNEIRAINSGNLGMGRTIKRFAEDIANAESLNPSNENELVSEKTYQQAALLLSRGASTDEVADSCDIPPAEVELLAIMRHSGVAKAS
jgi:hypothetical protein